MSSDSDTSSTSSESDSDSEKAPSVASGFSKSSSEADTDVDQSTTAALDSKTSAKEHLSQSTSSSSSEATSKDQRVSATSVIDATQSRQHTLSTEIDESQKPRHTWQDLILSSPESTRLLKLTEPERARNWLKRVIKADSQAELVQATLWHAYRNQFLSSTTDGNKLLTPTQLIQCTRDMFVGARTAIITTLEKKYVIKGVRPRKLRRKEGAVEQLQTTAPPGQGKKATRRRNQRRKDAKKLKSSTRQGEIQPQPSASAASAKSSAKSDTASKTHTSTPVNAARAGQADDVDARRKALLEAIASGGVDIEQNISTTEGLVGPSQPDHAPSNQQDNLESSEIVRTSGEVDAHDPQGNATGDDDDRLLPESADISTSWPKNESFSKPERPRAKIDLASSRRLLFGALGLRTPKSKEEEKALQDKLMKDNKALKQPHSDRAAKQSVGTATEEDDESWRDRIVLKAVECCQEGVELSTPPFPFVQRWDPQQQNGYNDKLSRRERRKLRRRERDHRDHEPKVKENKLAPSMDNFAMNQVALEEQQTYDAQPNSIDAYQSAANKQLLRESDEAAANLQSEAVTEKDLPFLPEDVTTCPTLTQEKAKAGTVIAFKKLDMSVETNWEPIISGYRTAIIDDALDDGTLCMTLALRDQPKSGTVYDAETGDRLYHKFEMPGFQDENEHENAGRLDLPFVELIEPKIIQADEHTHTDNTINIQEDSDPSAAQTLPEHGVSTTTSLPDSTIKQTEEAEGGDHGKSLEDNVVAEEVNRTGDVDVQALPNDDDLAKIKYPDLDERLQNLSTSVDQQAQSRRSSPVATYTALSDTKAGSPKPAGTSPNNDVRQEILSLLEDAGWRSSIGVPSDDSKVPQPKQTEQKRSIEVHVRSSDPPSETSNLNAQPYEEEQAETLPAEVPETLQQANEIGDSVPGPITTPDRSHSERPSEGERPLYGEIPMYDNEDHQSWDAQDAQEVARGPTSNSMSPPSSEPSAFAPISPPEVTKNKSKVRKIETAARHHNSHPKSSKTRTRARNEGPQPNINGSQHFRSDGASSDDDLPSLDKVLGSQVSSPRRPSFSTSENPTFKAEESQSNLHDLPNHKHSQKSEKSQISKRTESSSINSPLPILSDEDEGLGRGFVFSSQIPPGSQVVDLTLSSGPVEPPDSAYEGDSSLPNGPGWVRKLTRKQMEKKGGKSRHVELRKGGKVATVRR